MKAGQEDRTGSRSRLIRYLDSRERRRPDPVVRAHRRRLLDAAVREHYLGRLTVRELEQLAALFEKAQPGVVTAATWPPTGGNTET
jgi:hypothetical protein